MRLQVLTYRLTKIKGVLVSVGICALTNATMVLTSVVGAAGLALAFSSAAQATPGCADGTLSSSTGISTTWTSGTVCSVTGTITQTDGDALTANGSNLSAGSLTNYGSIHATLDYSSGYIGALSNVTNVDSIKNNGNSQIVAEYAPGVGALALNFNINAVNNQPAGTIQSFSNYGLIQATINSTISAGAVFQGMVVGVKNDGTIGTFTNGSLISASLGNAVSRTSNTFFVVGLANSNQIGVLTNTGTIEGDDVAILNGIIGAPGPSSATISQLTNNGSISAGINAIENYGTIGSLTNGAGNSIVSTHTGNTQGTGIYNAGAIGSLTNQGVITADAFYGAGINNQGGSITALSNSGSIGGGQYGVSSSGNIGTLTNSATGSIVSRSTGMVQSTAIYNAGQIGSLTNSGVVTTNSDFGAGINNLGGSIGTLSNNGSISGGQYGVANSSGGTISELDNTAGVIHGGYTGIYNNATIVSLTNDGQISSTNSKGIWNDQYGTISNLINAGQILGGVTGILNNGSIASLNNSGTIEGQGAKASYGINNIPTGGEGGPGIITLLTNSGSIAGVVNGIGNSGTIGTLVNELHGTISGATAIYNSGSIGTLTNAGSILAATTGLLNSGGTIGTLSNSGNVIAGMGIDNDDGSIGSLVNSGKISGRTSGIENFGTISTLVNSGKITGASDAIYNTSLIVSLNNQGLLSGGTAGLYNDGSGSIGALSNSGTISGTANAGIRNDGLIGSLDNTGHITGASAGIANGHGTINALTNSGTIEATGKVGDGVYNAGSIASLTNSGLIQGTRSGVYNAAASEPLVVPNFQPFGKGAPALITTLTNSSTGTISGTETGIYNASLIGAVANSGLISAPTAINVAAGGSLGLLTNSGKVAGSIVNASANDLSIAGGSGGVFGTLTGYSGGLGVSDIGQITNTASNVAFTAGNLVLNDHVNVGTGTVSNAATLQVDNALDIKGNYLQTSAGTLSVGVASLAKHGELDVSSAATVNADGHVALTPLDGFRFAAGERFTVIEAGSATYNVASMSALAGGFSGGYLMNEVQTAGQSDLVVCLTNLVKANCNSGIAYSNATSSNAIVANNAAGGYMGSNVALNKLADAVVTLGTSPAANRAGNQLSADPHNNASVLATQPSLDVLNVVTGHADSARLAANGGGSGVSAGESGPGLATWGEAFGGGSHQSEDGQYSGYSMSSEGVVAGGDAAVADSNVRVGGVFSYTHADLNEHGDRTGDTLSLDSYGVLGYGSFIGEHAYVDLLGGVLFDKFDTVRVVSFTNFSGVATGSHDGTQYVAKAAGGYRLPMGASGTTLTPIWGLTYSHLNQDSYTETGGNGAALHVNSLGDNSLKGEVGLKLEHNFPMAHGDVVPEVRVMYRHEFDSGAQVQTASFAADENASFSTLDARPIENSGVFSTGVNFLGKDGMTVTLRYTAEAATGYVSQGGSLRVRWSF